MDMLYKNLKADSKICVYKYIHIYISYARSHGLTGTLGKVYLNIYRYSYDMRGLTGLTADVQGAHT